MSDKDALYQMSPDIHIHTLPDHRLAAVNFDTDNSVILSPDMLLVLQQFLAPASGEGALALLNRQYDLGESRLSDAFASLRRNSVLVEHRLDAELSTPYFRAYANLGLQRSMLRDTARTSSFLKAIEEVVKPGDVVLDIGTGTGILAFCSAKAGARKVYAVDNSEIILLAQEIAVDNGLQDRIEFIKGRIEDVDIAEKVDVVVSEWSGYFLLNENMFSSYVHGRDRFLRPGGKVIPSRARLYLVPIESPDLYRTDGYGYWESPVWGFDYTKALSRPEVSKPHSVVTAVQPDECLAEPKRLCDIDCVTASREEFHFDAKVEFEIDRDAVLHGFMGYFDLLLSPHVLLDTSPSSLETHWKQSYFPMKSIEVRKNDRILVSSKSLMTGEGRTIPIVIDTTVYRGSKQLHQLQITYQSL